MQKSDFHTITQHSIDTVKSFLKAGKCDGYCTESCPFRFGNSTLSTPSCCGTWYDRGREPRLIVACHEFLNIFDTTKLNLTE